VKIISDIVDDEYDMYLGRIYSLLARNPLPSRIRRQFFPEESEFPTTQPGKKLNPSLSSTIVRAGIRRAGVRVDEHGVEAEVGAVEEGGKVANQIAQGDVLDTPAVRV
jgi:hypothetical protein